MTHFLRKILMFLIPITLLLIAGLLLPPTPRASGSFLFSERKKDSLLKYSPAPRIIFVGGSNLSFGLNSEKVKEALHLNPVNTGVNFNIGIRYMLQNTLEYVKETDTIILAPEYELFYRSYDDGYEELLRTVFDVSPRKIKYLSFSQAIHLIGYVPKYSLTKFDPTEYWGFRESDVYSVNSYNKFGDVDAHWNLAQRKYPATGINGDLNKNVIQKIKDFETAANKKGAVLYLTFPCIDEASFNLSKEKVLAVEKVLAENNFKVLGNARRYVMPSNMMFNTKYHLNKVGLEYRTKLFIEDFKANRNK